MADSQRHDAVILDLVRVLASSRWRVPLIDRDGWQAFFEAMGPRRPGGGDPSIWSA